MRGRDAVWLYAAGKQVIYALGRVANIYTDEAGSHHANLNWDLPATRRLARAPIPRSSFHEVPQSVRRANPNTVAVLRRWMQSHEVSVSEADDLDGELSEGDARTKIRREIAQRRGQDRFRSQLLAAYAGTCAVTGETAQQVLEAAHIMPWRGEHTNVVRNGLLLRSDVHTLFDIDLLGIDSDCRVVISPVLKETSYWAYNGRRAGLPAAVPSRPSKQLLARRLRSLVISGHVQR